MYFAGTVGVDECKAVLQEQKAKDTRRKVREFRMKQMFKQAAPQKATDAGATTQPKTQTEGAEEYGTIFAPSNLKGQTDSDATPDAENQADTDAFNSVFDPNNLKGQVNPE